MRTIRWGLVVWIVGSFLVNAPAWACSCVPPPGEAKALKQTDAVFSGTVTSVDDPDGGGKIVSSGREVSWEFDVDAVAKGDVQNTQIVTSAADGASCGYVFEVGSRYLVFADDGEQGLSTNLCSNTRPMAEDEEVPFDTTPPEGSDGGGSAAGEVGDVDEPTRYTTTGTVMFVISLAVVLAGGTILFLRIRRRTHPAP